MADPVLLTGLNPPINIHRTKRLTDAKIWAYRPGIAFVRSFTERAKPRLCSVHQLNFGILTFLVGDSNTHAPHYAQLLFEERVEEEDAFGREVFIETLLPAIKWRDNSISDTLTQTVRFECFIRIPEGNPHAF